MNRELLLAVLLIFFISTAPCAIAAPCLPDPTEHEKQLIDLTFESALHKQTSPLKTLLNTTLFLIEATPPDDDIIDNQESLLIQHVLRLYNNDAYKDTLRQCLTENRSDSEKTVIETWEQDQTYFKSETFFLRFLETSFPPKTSFIKALKETFRMSFIKKENNEIDIFTSFLFIGYNPISEYKKKHYKENSELGAVSPRNENDRICEAPALPSSSRYAKIVKNWLLTLLGISYFPTTEASICQPLKSKGDHEFQAYSEEDFRTQIHTLGNPVNNKICFQSEDSDARIEILQGFHTYFGHKRSDERNYEDNSNPLNLAKLKENYTLICPPQDNHGANYYIHALVASGIASTLFLSNLVTCGYLYYKHNQQKTSNGRRAEYHSANISENHQNQTRELQSFNSAPPESCQYQSLPPSYTTVTKNN